MSAKDDEPSDLTSMVKNKRKNNKDAGSFASKLRAKKDRARARASASRHQEDSSQNIDDARRTVKTDATKLEGLTSQPDVASGSAPMSRTAFDKYFSIHRPQTPENQARDQPFSIESTLQEDFEDIDLEDKVPRSSSDDPDYDIIDASEATHSARNAQPDRADKYPEREAHSLPVVGHSDVGDAPDEKGKTRSSEPRNWRRGWFF